MILHHDKHHAAYVNNVNEAAQVALQVAERPVDYVLTHLADLPESVRTKVRNNLGAMSTTPCSGRSWAKMAERQAERF